MASTNIISCDGCDNVILPGDIIAITTKGILAGTDGSIDILEVEGSQPVHFCDSCATETAQEIRQAVADAAAADLIELALADPAGLGGCCLIEDEGCANCTGSDDEDRPVTFEDMGRS